MHVHIDMHIDVLTETEGSEVEQVWACCLGYDQRWYTPLCDVRYSWRKMRVTSFVTQVTCNVIDE